MGRELGKLVGVGSKVLNCLEFHLVAQIQRHTWEILYRIPFLLFACPPIFSLLIIYYFFGFGLHKKIIKMILVIFFLVLSLQFCLSPSNIYINFSF